MGYKIARYGWLPDLPDQRDHFYAAPVELAGVLPARQRFVVRNSWGGKWGLKGYFTLPYAYVTGDNLANDFWTIRVVQ